MQTAEAWDLWRIASCEEQGTHAWRFLAIEGETLSLACERCPCTEVLHPRGDLIILPWGLTLPVVAGMCEYCETGFRRPHTGGPPPRYCKRTHADRAKEKRKKTGIRTGKEQRRQRREAREAAYRLAAPRLAAEAAARAEREAAALPPCPHPEKLAFASAEDAVGHAVKNARTFGRAYRTYQCVAGHWHLTGRYAKAQFVPDLRTKGTAP